jgi:hypothetical protein
MIMFHVDPTYDPADEMCDCGETASQHVDGCEQCFIPDCGCKEFEPVAKDEE